MPLRRLLQFCVLYGVGLAMLFCYKYGRGLSDYVIPSPNALLNTARQVFVLFAKETADTMTVALLGHFMSIGIAAVVAILGRLNNWFGSLITAAAYNLQAYPIVAVAPIIFILVGDGFLSRLIIGALICYFPLLLGFLGVLATPIFEVEHFFVVTGRRSWWLEVQIRAFENRQKITTVVVGTATMAVVGTIVAEFIAADHGIGYSIRIALNRSDMDQILVSLFTIGLFSFAYITALEMVTKKISLTLAGERCSGPQSRTTF